MVEQADIVKFWFGSLDEHGLPTQAKRRAWFQKNSDFDGTVRQRFEPTLHALAKAMPPGWMDEGMGLLAAILVFDQFPRNMYRNSAQSFAFDAKALALCQRARAKGLDAAVPPIMRSFVYMPLMHSENLVDQDASVSLFCRLYKGCEGPLRDILRSNWEFALKHRNIVAHYGRFPHRNHILGRSSSPDEVAFLRQPGSRF